MAKNSRSPLTKLLTRQSFGGPEARKERDTLVKQDDTAKEMARRFPKRLLGG